MRLVDSKAISVLQNNTENIRNICILAHVDHGKTTLADSLVASNGIISPRLAGKLRYMDSRKDEQERGITMKSSAITLFHKNKNDEEFLVNLIDSPGHVDFASEVSTAIRLCDGAVLIVDVVEGVCAQTITAIKQVWNESLKPILVFNKIDRLILETKMAPLDAYVHICQLLEKVNAVVAELLVSDVLGSNTNMQRRSRTVSNTGTTEDIEQNLYDWSSGLDDVDDSKYYFAPEEGNVVFASAIDGWGFRISDFAQFFSKKLGFSAKALSRTLWGDFYVNTKKKRIMKGAQEKAKKPLSVQLIFENIWAVYNAVCIRKDKEQTTKIVDTLNIQVSSRDLKHSDCKHTLFSVMSRWLPLASALLETVIDHLPSPKELTEEKIEKLMFSSYRNSTELPEKTRSLKQCFSDCNIAEDAPVIVFISKMMSFDYLAFPENKPRILTHEEIMARREQARQRYIQNQENKQKQSDGETDNTSNTALNPALDNLKLEETVELVTKEEKNERFVAFARVYSGTLRKNSKLFVLGPKHKPGKIFQELQDDVSLFDSSVTLKDLEPGKYVTVCSVNKLYLLMGRELEPVESVPAGNILGIGDLDEHVLKTATLSTTVFCPSFTDLNFITTPILRVAVEPKHTQDLNKLNRGLQLLNQADPCVQVLFEDTGESIIVTAGEVHLQRCLDDLKERFAKIDVTCSQPIVPFRETVVHPPKIDMVNEIVEHQSAPKSESYSAERKIISVHTPDGRSEIKLKAIPLPRDVTSLLEKSVAVLRSLNKIVIKQTSSSHYSDSVLSEIREFKAKLDEKMQESDLKVFSCDDIVAFGPKGVGSNMLFCNVKGYRHSVWQYLDEERTWSAKSENDDLDRYLSNIVHGFQLATASGPLCEEQMMGVGIVIEEWSVSVTDFDGEDTTLLPSNYGPLSGQIVSVMKDGCRQAFSVQPQRLMIAMYSCNIQVTSEVLGKLYALLGKRGGRILHGDLQEGSSVFEVTAMLPVIESFDFANEVRRHTSGLALPQLVFSDWELLEIDPFWQPSTEEEYLHFGEKADTENRARKYMNSVRKRKGLRVEEKLVEFGEKQRTLTRNK